MHGIGWKVPEKNWDRKGVGLFFSLFLVVVNFWITQCCSLFCTYLWPPDLPLQRIVYLSFFSISCQDFSLCDSVWASNCWDLFIMCWHWGQYWRTNNPTLNPKGFSYWLINLPWPVLITTLKVARSIPLSSDSSFRPSHAHAWKGLLVEWERQSLVHRDILN